MGGEARKLNRRRRHGTRPLFHALSTAFANDQNEEISLDIEMDVSENSGTP